MVKSLGLIINIFCSIFRKKSLKKPILNEQRVSLTLSLELAFVYWNNLGVKL